MTSFSQPKTLVSMKVERTAYNGIILTPKALRIKKTCPRSNGYIKLCAMGEVGERAVAQTLRNIATGKQNDEVPIELTPDTIPITTQQLVEQGMMTPNDEVAIQLKGVDVVLITKGQLDERTQITTDFIELNSHLCIQVKLQPFANTYRTITVETCTDLLYEHNKPLNTGKHYFVPSGVNKTISKWTAYIVTGGTIIFIETNKLRESINGKERKYQGTAWGPANSKRAVGATANILSLLQTGMASALHIDPIFRTYLSSLSHVEDEPINFTEYSWKLFIQNWSPSVLKKYLSSGIYALTEEEVTGNIYL